MKPKELEGVLAISLRMGGVGSNRRGQKIIVNILKHIGLTLVQLAKHVGGFPQAVANAVKRRKVRTVLDEREAERLDRIRNPDKYRGKEI